MSERTTFSKVIGTVGDVLAACEMHRMTPRASSHAGAFLRAVEFSIRGAFLFQ